jgi:hypothetical protein
MTRREPIDMSESAIARRLEVVRALYKLMVSLRQVRAAKARPVRPS